MKTATRVSVLAVVLPLTFWVVTKVVTAPIAARAQGQNTALLLNGDFSHVAEGTELPNHWGVHRERDTRARVSLETQGARSSPAALGITVERGTARVQQTLPNVSLAPLVLSGYAKAPAADQKVQGILQVFAATDDEPIQTISVPIARSTEWKLFSQRLLFPSSAIRAVLSFEVIGEGNVWLDDISIAPAPQGASE